MYKRKPWLTTRSDDGYSIGISKMDVLIFESFVNPLSCQVGKPKVAGQYGELHAGGVKTIPSFMHLFTFTLLSFQAMLSARYVTLILGS